MLVEKLKKLMEKKGEEIAPEKLDAKRKAVEEMRGIAKGAMKGGLEGLQKVTVASPSKEGLKEGLEKAEDVVEGMPKLGGDKDAPAESSEEGMELEEEEEDMAAGMEPGMEQLEELLAKLPPEKLKEMLLKAIKG